jgi:hypothetical protein
VADKKGDIFGTTFQGGIGSCLPVGGCGTVFEAVPVMDPSGATKWEAGIIYKFKGGDEDGGCPNGPVVVGATGNLYGTTLYGGGTGCGGVGCGTVFELHMHGGRWEETVLYKFAGGADGGNPESAVALNSAGNIFGTTYNGGLNVCYDKGPCGVVFELQRGGSGWTETILHSFDYKDGAQPLGSLAVDDHGNLYGTTPYGGQPHLDPFEPTGTVFELSPRKAGWSFQVLYRFAPGAGGSAAGPTLDAEGNLYGTTNAGGSNGSGSVFELQPPTETGGQWAFSTLHSFTLVNDGGFPVAGVVFDKAGNLYGTAGAGGNTDNCQVGCGVVFELTPSGRIWAETLPYSFLGGTSGATPETVPLLDPYGNIYGTTASGGDDSCIVYGPDSGCGILYRISANSRLGRTLGARVESAQ